MKVVILLLVVAVSLEGKRYRSDYSYYPDAGGWLKLQRVPADWREARLRCHLEGGTLASPLNHDLKEALSSLVEKHHIGCGIFTGIHATFSRGDFASVEGIPLARIPHEWATGEPNNDHNGEQCLLMLPGGGLADVSCADTFPYACYCKHNTQVLNACGNFDSEYQLDARTGSCYKFHTVPRVYSRAHMACAAEGGHLAIINSELEASVIGELIAKYPPHIGKDFVFLGFHDWGEHGEWLTVQGQTLQQAGYSNWEGGQPNNATTGEHRGQFCGGVTRSGRLDDLFCGLPYSFICEKAPNSLLWNDDQ